MNPMEIADTINILRYVIRVTWIFLRVTYDFKEVVGVRL